MIGIIDYGMGNLGSVTNAFEFLEIPAKIITSPDEMDGMHAIVLPGVGAFGDCMAHLDEHGFVVAVQEWVRADKPFLGICLGLQVLYEGSEESEGVPGLGLLPGKIKLFPSNGLKVPQIGWNTVTQVQKDCPLFEGIPDQSYFYCVHSYYAGDAAGDAIAGTTDYGLNYTSVAWRGRMMAVQFHPEKSQALGLRMIRNFAAWEQKN